MQADDVLRIVETIHGEVPSQTAQLTGGWSGTQVWRVELASGPHLVRIFAPRHNIVATREAAALEHGGRLGLPVSRVIARGEVGERPVLLLEWLEGRELREILIAEPGGAGAYGEPFGRLQAQLHRLDSPPDLPHALDWPARDAFPERLRSLLLDLPSRPDRFLHLDFHPANVLVNDGEMSGLIDWTNARRGDPRFDLARTWVILRVLPGLDQDTKAQSIPVVRLFVRGWHRAYRAEHGPVEGIAPFLAWAGYGLICDLGGKTADLVGEEAAKSLAVQIRELERDTERWMAMAGL